MDHKCHVTKMQASVTESTRPREWEVQLKAPRTGGGFWMSISPPELQLVPSPTTWSSGLDPGFWKSHAVGLNLGLWLTWCWLDSDICIAVHSVICCQPYSWNAKYNRWWRALKRWKRFHFIRKTCLYSKSTTIKWAAFSCYVEGDIPRDLIRNQVQLCKLVNSPITV